MEKKAPVFAVNETADGEGVVRSEGKTVFVRGMMRGETGEIEITQEEKRFSRARLSSLAVASPERIRPECPYYESCGGCSLGHVTAAHELTLKKERVRDALERIGGFSEEEYVLSDTVGGKRTGYRNKAELRFRPGPGFGYVGRDGGFCPVEDCLLLPKEMNRLLSSKAVKSVPGLSGCVIRTNRKGESMLILETREEISLPPDLLREYGVTSLWRLIPKEKPVHALDGELIHLWGESFLTEEIAGLSFRLSPRSFFQINREIAEKLYRHASMLAGLREKDLAVDAYSGVGAIGMTAAKSAGEVVGVEVIPEAVKNAEEAAEQNGIGNISFLAGRCEELLPRDSRLRRAKAIFLDPPRKGCDRRMLEAIVRAGIERIVYVSCDPATLARDLRILKESGYRLTSVTPYNMFPMTGHVESVVLITRAG